MAARTPGSPRGRRPEAPPDLELTPEDLTRLPVVRRGNRKQYQLT